MASVTATTTVDPINLNLPPGYIAVSTGPVDGVWTVVVEDASQEILDAAIAEMATEATALANRLALVLKAKNAQTANATFLAIGTPTNAQVLAQTKALTRQVNALIKLALSELSDTSGT